MTSSSSRKGSLTSRLTQAPLRYERVRARVRFVGWLPKKVNGFAPIPHRIYINRRKFPRFDDQDIAFLGLLFHEAWHQVQMREVGWFRWITNYLFSREFRLASEMTAHVFGDIQKFHVYPVERMRQWAEKNIKSYFRFSHVPMSADNIEKLLGVFWTGMKEIAVVLEYEL